MDEVEQRERHAALHVKLDEVLSGYKFRQPVTLEDVEHVWRAVRDAMPRTITVDATHTKDEVTIEIRERVGAGLALVGRRVLDVED